MPKHRLEVSRFLNGRGHHAGAYILARVSDTSNERGSYVEPDTTLAISDCGRVVSLDFPMWNEPDRRNSVRKARMLADVATRFAEAIEAEAELSRRRASEARGARIERAGLTDWMVNVETADPVRGLSEERLEDMAEAFMLSFSGVLSWTRDHQ